MNNEEADKIYEEGYKAGYEAGYTQAQIDEN